MDRESTTPVRSSGMPVLPWRRLGSTLVATGLLAGVVLLPPVPAQAAVGVEKVSRHAGAPGDGIDLTLGCGFCYPPCNGPAGHPEGPCMPGKALPPESFPISLVPIEKAPKPHRCGPNALCSPGRPGPPRRAPYTFLGLATPPAEGDETQHSSGGSVPRYVLHFDVPNRQPGVYAFVIYCDACLRGKSGSLIADPAARPWRLRVLPSTPKATASP